MLKSQSPPPFFSYFFANSCHFLFMGPSHRLCRRSCQSDFMRFARKKSALLKLRYCKRTDDKKHGALLVKNEKLEE